MYSLSNFYKSKEWERLLIQIKDERIHNDGLIYCEYCHKPIIKAYDCIGHHKEHLTEENVNDRMISLNPDNVALVHHKCHNIIHEKFKYSSKKIYLVYGSPLAGKSTYVHSSMSKGDLVIDIDSIWQCVSGEERYIKDGRLNAVVFAVRDTLIECVKYRRGKWLNAYIIGGYPLISERERLCKELGAVEIFIDTKKEECLKRLIECEDNRDKKMWETYINDWWDKYKASPRLV